MDSEQVRARVKGIIAEVASLQIDGIADNAALVDDLHLDSLALLEVAVEVDHVFRLGVPEERLQELRTVGDAVALVLERQEAQNLASQVA